MGENNGGGGMMMIVILIGGACCLSLLLSGGMFALYYMNKEFKKWVDGLFGKKPDGEGDPPLGEEGEVPDGFLAGTEGDVDMYACKGINGNNTLPGKLWYDKCLVTWNGNESATEKYEKLKPEKAFEWTQDKTKSKIYVGDDWKLKKKQALCRAKPSKGSDKYPGKTADGIDGCYVGYAGKEEFISTDWDFATYDVDD